MRGSDYGRLVWGTLIELGLGVLLFLLASLLTTNAERAAFIRETAGEWLTVTGQVLFPAAIAIWVTYVNIESTSFGDYLRYRGASGAFHFSFAYPAFIFFGATLALIFTKGSKVTWIPVLAIFLVAYACVVFMALVFNVTAVMRLFGAFRTEVEAERRRSNLAADAEQASPTSDRHAAR